MKPASESVLIWLALVLGVLLVAVLPPERWVADTLAAAGLVVLVLIGLFGLVAGRGWSKTQKSDRRPRC